MTSAGPSANNAQGELNPQRLVLFLTSDVLGTGPEELGRILLRSFLKACTAPGPAPWRVLLLNNGIRLSLEGSPLLDDLRSLEVAGVEILSCGTCLDYFQVRDRLRVGRVSSMPEIVHSLRAADRIVRL